MMIYLAGKMRGLPGLNHDAFAAGAATLRTLGHHVFNPAENGLSASSEDVRRFLAVDLAWITGCAEAVVVLPGWETSRGARAEVATARAIEIPVWELALFASHGSDAPEVAHDPPKRDPASTTAADLGRAPAPHPPRQGQVKPPFGFTGKDVTA